jgi:glycosyltransferase involved in cell wall biosynthesis
MNTAVDSRWIGMHGIGRYASEILQNIPYNHEIDYGGKSMDAIDPLKLKYFLQSKSCKLFYSPGPNGPVGFSGKTAITVHDLMFLEVPGEVSHLKKLYFNNITKNICKKADVVFTVSAYSKERIEQWLGRRDIVVAHNGVSKEFFPNMKKNTDKKSPPFFLYVGNRRKHKNFNGLLKAFSIFSNDSGCLNENYELHITGCNNRQLNDILKNLNIENNVKFLGDSLSKECLADSYRNAFALLIPSFYEGFGMPALEAMACGTPVIASNSTALCEIVNDAGLLIDPYDVYSISDAMNTIVSDDELHKILIKKGINRASKYSWHTSSLIIRDALSEIGWPTKKYI